MVPRGSGKIVTIASMLSFQGGFRAAAVQRLEGRRRPADEGARKRVGAARRQRQRDRARVREDRASTVTSGGTTRSGATAILARLPAGRWGEPVRPRRAPPSSSPPPRRTTSTGSCSRSTEAGLAADAADGRWLEGLRVLVTGAAGGLGRALVAEADLRGRDGRRDGPPPEHRHRRAAGGGDQGGRGPARPRRLPPARARGGGAARRARHRRQQRRHARLPAVQRARARRARRGLGGEPARAGADHAGELPVPLRAAPRPRSSTSSRPQASTAASPR